MKRILLLLYSIVALVMLGSVNVYAQNKKDKKKPQPVKLDPMFYKLGKFTVGYDVIDKTQYRNYFTPEEFQRINEAFNLRNAGIGVLAGGAGLCVVGAVLMGVGERYMEQDYARQQADGIEYDSNGDALFWSGFGVMMAGGGLVVGAGVPLFCVGDARLKKAAQGYNERNNITLSFKLGQYGPGLALYF